MPNKGTEAHFWADIRKHIPDVHWQRIESPTPGGGIPDVHGCLDGVSAWIELKVVKGRRVLLTPEQCNWLTRYSTYGGRCYVVAQHVLSDTVYVWDGARARDIKNDGTNANGQTVTANWEELENILFRLP